MFRPQGGLAMILTQEQAFLKAKKQLHHLIALVRQAADEGWRIDQAERSVMAELLQVGHSLLAAFVARQGDGDDGETVGTPEGETARRLEQPHQRRYVSIFGELTIRRFVYGSREGQKILAVPLDARLGLPAGDFSYVLEDWAQRLGVQESFAEAGRSLATLLGLHLHSRTLEHMNRELADWTFDFRDAQPAPPRKEEGEVLVVTADGKGVPMRRPLEERIRAPHRRGKGEKANKKQMAYVGAVYSIDRFVRTADEVIDELQRRQRASDRPKPCHKRVWAEMTEVLEGETINGKELLFTVLANEADARDQGSKKPTVCLLDGEKALWEWYRESLPGAVGILDLFHVLERLWLAAYCFHAEGSKAAEAFVEERLRMLLEGKVGGLIGGLRQMRTKHGLTGSKAKTLASVIGYLENNREHMCYDEYLAAGYPIGSGVAEGACRHYVKDRMERSGMRWTLEGAQAMLHIRTIYLNGDWDEFIEHRIQAEQKALHGKMAA
jgi:hypothetical protein